LTPFFISFKNTPVKILEKYGIITHVFIKIRCEVCFKQMIMKNIKTHLKKMLLEKLKMYTSLCFVFNFLTLTAQPPFENHYGKSVSGNDGPGTEFTTCGSIDLNYTYVGVHAIEDPTASGPVFTIRGVRIKSDGTMFAANFDFIQHLTKELNIFPLKIIPINSNTEYLITGYVTSVNLPDLPYPFIIKADQNLDATDFKVISDHTGFFCDVDELPNSDLLFVGATTNSLKIAANTRLGWILRTDNTNFTAQWMRYTSLYNHVSTNKHQDFDVVSDAIVIDSDSAIICGTVSQQVVCSSNDSTNSLVFVAKLNLNNGSFNWHRAIFKKNVACKLALNIPNSLIVLATNGDVGSSLPAIIIFDRGGNLISSKSFEPSDDLQSVNFKLNGINYTTDIGIHAPFVQNLYFNDDDDEIFISGKFINVIVQDLNPPFSILGSFEMPFNFVYTVSTNSFSNLTVYKSSQIFNIGVSHFLTYDQWSSGNCGELFPPLVSVSNTLPCLANCGTNEYVTITLDCASNVSPPINIGIDKVWVHSNDNTKCGYDYQSIEQFNLSPLTHIDISNDNIEVTPEVQNKDFSNSNPSKNDHNCTQ